MNDQDNFYRELLDSLSDGVYFVDELRRIVYWSGGAERITGYSRQQVLGKCCADNLLMHVNSAGDLLCLTACPLANTIADGQPREADVFLHHADGHRLPVSVRTSPVRDQDGRIVGAIEAFNNNASRLTALQQLEEWQRAALLDPLTSVANRRYLEMKIQGSLLDLQRNQFPFGLLFADIDHFKRVNDTYGHDCGDRVLKMAANVFKSNVRAFDFVGRFGGEEFVIILNNLNPDFLAESANRLRTLVERSLLIEEDDEINVTVSIGATLALAEDSVESVLKRADQLLYQSKANGRNCVTIG